MTPWLLFFVGIAATAVLTLAPYVLALHDAAQSFTL